MNETIAYAIEIAAGVVFVPWCTFVTVAIFSLRQDNALIKQQINFLSEVKSLLHTVKEKLI